MLINKLTKNSYFLRFEIKGGRCGSYIHGSGYIGAGTIHFNNRLVLFWVAECEAEIAQLGER
jgi:hypothetical protein